MSALGRKRPDRIQTSKDRFGREVVTAQRPLKFCSEQDAALFLNFNSDTDLNVRLQHNAIATRNSPIQANVMDILELDFAGNPQSDAREIDPTKFREGCNYGPSRTAPRLRKAPSLSAISGGTNYGVVHRNDFNVPPERVDKGGQTKA